MEYRKLISFGKSSFVVSLPKSWVTQNKLKKGDLVYFEERNPDLILSKKELHDDSVEKSIIINVDGKPLDRIEREVNSAYILNYRTITIKGEEVKVNIKSIQQILQNLIALETMEQTPNSLIAKDFLDMDKVSVDEIIHKMDMVTRAMFKESCQHFTAQNYENINERDKDVNRLYFLLYRAVLYGMNNPALILKNFKLNSIALFNHLFSGYYIESVADEVRRISRHLHNLKLSPKEKETVEQFLNTLYNYYLDTMKVLYSKNVELALELSDEKKKLNKTIDSFEKFDVHGAVTYRLRRLVSCIHCLGRIVYQGYNYY